MDSKCFDYDVIIIGGGSSGVSAAYALKNRGYKVALVEQAEKLGGTACNSWVETWIQALIPPHIEEIFNQLPDDKKKVRSIMHGSVLFFLANQRAVCLWIEMLYQKSMKKI